ncbi:MAG TPA: cyanophycin synthetase [Thermoleophilia bacterium]|nr:cyanophycin synthetase [Thermoleophilia bacterium]
MSALLDALGRPQDAYRVIHVVGTNGKSSTTRYCEALLRAHGLRSGGYLSPHISGWTERVLVGGRPVDEGVFGRAVEAVRAAVAGLPDELGETTQFEVLTVAALLALAESGVEAAALEAGLGGRLDATNVVDAPVVVLTNIALEHTEVLGGTRELIFAEKAAVIKGGDVVFGALDGLEPEARRVCAAVGAAPHFLRLAEGPALRVGCDGGRGLESSTESGAEFGIGSGTESGIEAGDFTASGAPTDFTVTLDVDGRAERYGGLSVPTPALYQVQNAGLAVAAVRLLLGRLDEAAAREALAATAVPGRLQKVSERPLLLADGAHNPDGVRVLAQSLAAVAVPKPTVGVLAIMRDKDYGEMLERFFPLLDAAVCTQASEPRSLTAGELAAALRAAAVRLGRDFPAPVVEPDPHAAVALARAQAGPSGAVLIGGSLYLLEDLADILVGR